jgi:hypothetical protein
MSSSSNDSADNKFSPSPFAGVYDDESNSSEPDTKTKPQARRRRNGGVPPPPSGFNASTNANTKTDSSFTQEIETIKKLLTTVLKNQ